MTQVQSALNRAITNYEMRFGGGDANQQKTRLERIKRAIDVVARATLERLRREGRSLKYYIALKLTFHKASDVLTVTDPRSRSQTARHLFCFPVKTSKLS